MKQNTSKSNSRKSDSRKPVLIAVVVIAVVIALIIIFDTESEPPRATTSPSSNEMIIQITDEHGNILLATPESEAVKLFNDLLAAIHPVHQENAYMTPFMKEKIVWVYNEIAANRLEFRPYAGFGRDANGKEDRMQEEMRTWFKVNKEAVRELRSKGQPLDLDFIEVDDILKRCQDDLQCPEFKDYVTKKTF